MTTTRRLTSDQIHAPERLLASARRRARGNLARWFSAATRLALAMLVAAAATALLGSGFAVADPDPHIPDMAAGYCPGGGMGSQIYLAYCDGVPYPDGSYWHTIQYEVPVIGHPNGLLSPGMQCVVNPGGGPAPQPAPPGGCGGAVQ
jgi:hypothetical protein